MPLVPGLKNPMDIISSRDRFRQSPPQDLAQVKYADVEGSLGALISLYHIRKLLSSHGIRPAFDMLEEKLKQGNFARLFSRNETIHKAKVIMQQNLSHGAHSPKFSKMLEVLVEHFTKHDPQTSRVIIFSHFRNSVSDILSSLATIGEYVKAAEFVGQSSGKTSKGQSQKVQQAVLQKFRDGGYNVIVATSIGEEGLDIMEVDLVLCFDANISPIRMIQRMGRTGRKSKGRVVILACQGTELSGYKSKQAKGKAVNKHMVNAERSFSFHPSPRMVPHVYKPEKKLFKFSIEEFVPRGKKVKEDDATQTPKYKLELTDAETHLLKKYFDPVRQDSWRPSLIAFPHFQAFPSRVHEIAHSMRTTMLIDTMQYLQGLSFDSQDEEASEEPLKVDHHNSNTKEDDLARNEPETDTVSLMDTSKTKEKHHCFLFGSDFATVDSNGNILILSVPFFPPKHLSPTKSTIPQSIYGSKSDNSSHLKASSEENPAAALDLNEDDLIIVASFNDLQQDKPDRVTQTEICSEEILKRELDGSVIPDVVEDDSHSVEAGDLSPRLTNLLMSGVVPESPMHNDFAGTPNASIPLIQSKNDEAVKESTPDKEIVVPQINLPNNSIEEHASGFKFVGEIRTPLTNLSNKSCSKDWILSSGEKSVSQPKKKLKRLRKFCDMKSGKEETVGHPSVSVSRSLDHAFDKHGRGGRKLRNDAQVFIDDEAEASSEASDDEEVDDGEDSYGGSFIDDRMAPTQAETAQFDMMAVYRRSLLTQSPMVDYSSDTHDDGSAAGTTSPSVHTNRDSSSSLSSGRLNTKRLSSDTLVILSTTDEATNDTKRRKSSFSEGGRGPLPICNLEKEIFLKPDKEVTLQTDEMFLKPEDKQVTLQMDAFDDDDEFLQGIDLDALEEQASKQLRSKSNILNEKPKIQDLDFFDSPSFDLGI